MPHIHNHGEILPSANKQIAQTDAGVGTVKSGSELDKNTRVDAQRIRKNVNVIGANDGSGQSNSDFMGRIAKSTISDQQKAIGDAGKELEASYEQHSADRKARMARKGYK